MRKTLLATGVALICLTASAQAHPGLLLFLLPDLIPTVMDMFQPQGVGPQYGIAPYPSPYGYGGPYAQGVYERGGHPHSRLGSAHVRKVH